jgi:hypothetical protein
MKHFTLHYSRLHTSHTREFDTLGDAVYSAAADSDAGAIYPHQITQGDHVVMDNVMLFRCIEDLWKQWDQEREAVLGWLD